MAGMSLAFSIAVLTRLAVLAPHVHVLPTVVALIVLFILLPLQSLLS